ncbi:hypothetical protein D3C76_1789450 [compost metagenome]
MLRAAGQFQLAYLGRAIQRFITQADPVADKLQAVLYIQAVGRVRQLHAIRRQALWVNFDYR